ncbi:LOW QUALITY PROTEIN: Pol protein [Phytophthora palmivora]|uniref:Pol protein n=1 Tax=Phytophthora palmivora TaxID=4796 RepID=A0A2P4XGR9_9STRA|nr:LOW QUALITY PROTEIN: Pol protein [Phytophthora palmivora]
MSIVDRPRTDGKTERVNRVLEDTLRSIYAEAPRSWSDQLPMVEFALNNAVHASTRFTPFYLNGLRHPQAPLTLRGGTVASIVSGGEARKAFSSQDSDIETEQQADAISRRRNGVNPEQTEAYSDKNGRGNLSVFMVGDLVLLNTKNLPLTLVRSIESNKLKHRFIGPVGVLGRYGAANTIDLVKSMATHPTSYVGRLKRYDGPYDLRPEKAEEGQEWASSPRQIEVESRGQHQQELSKPAKRNAGWHPCGSQKEYAGSARYELRQEVYP